MQRRDEDGVETAAIAVISARSAVVVESCSGDRTGTRTAGVG